MARRAAVCLLLGSSAGAAYAAPRASDRKACDAAYEQAQTLRDAKHLTSARDPLRICAGPTCPIGMRNDCATWLADVEHRIPSVVAVANDGTGAAVPNVPVSIDGSAPRTTDGTAWDVDPGQHTFTFTFPDGSKVDRSVLVIEGQKDQRVSAMLASQALPIPALAPPPPEAPENAGHGRRVLGLVAGGVGVVGIILGGVFGGLTFSEWSSVKSECPSHKGCSPQALGDSSSAVTFSTASDVAFIAGGALVAAGLALYFTAPKADGSSLGLVVAPSGLGLTGRF